MQKLQWVLFLPHNSLSVFVEIGAARTNSMRICYVNNGSRNIGDAPTYQFYCFEGITFPDQNVARREPSPIVLDTAFVGHEVVIVKNGQRMCGSGGCLASAPLVQNKSYFEVKLQQNGVWGCGVATRLADLNVAPGGHDSESWVLCSDLCVRHSQNSLHKLNVQIQEGDVIGVWYDHVELNFSVNGKPLDCPVTGIKGIVFPALYVDDGAILDIVLDNFSNQPPSGFEKIMIEQSLL